jgi:hypothetical protein
VNVQVIADPTGRLVWASPALPGARHDISAAREHGILNAMQPLSDRPQRTRPAHRQTDES